MTTDMNALTRDEALKMLQRDYELASQPLNIDGLSLNLRQVADIHAHVERLVETVRVGGKVDLPFWAKVWPASVLMSYLLRRIPWDRSGSVLELGAGMAAPGLVAASLGHQVTITDIEPTALAFARLNALENDLGDKVQVLPLNFISDKLEQQFDYVLAAEISYKPEMVDGMLAFLRRNMRWSDQSEALVAASVSRSKSLFLEKAGRYFQVQEKVLGCKTSEGDGDLEQHLCFIFRLRPRMDVDHAMDADPAADVDGKEG